MRNKIVLVTICFSLILCFCETSATGVMTAPVKNMRGGPMIFYSTMDTMIVQNGPNNNFGTNPTMEVRNTGSGWEEDALVRFDISSLPPGTHIHNATLYLFYSHYQDNNPAGRTISLYRITSDWNENTVTWNTRPSIDSVATSSCIVPYQVGVWMKYDVTDDVQDFLQGTTVNYGWRLIDEQFWGGSDIPRTHYCTKENNNNIPYLEIITQNQNVPLTFLSGKINNLNTDEGVISFDAVHVRMITFIPFSFNTYVNGERITIEQVKVGFVTIHYVFGFFQATR